MKKEQNFQGTEARVLSVLIQTFAKNNKKIAPADWIVLNKLVKQLNKQKYSESRKVLDSMRSKFETIQRKYQEVVR